MQLDSLSYVELVQLKTDVEAEIARREQEEKAKARKQILEIARNFGLSVEDVLSKPAATRKPVEAKYRHPEDASLTWTGRGRKPVWVVEQLGAGKTLEQLAI